MAAVSGFQGPPSLPELFVQTGSVIRDLLDMKDSLLEPLQDEDNFPTEDFVFYLQLWDELLTSSTAADSLTHVPEEGAESYWITAQMLHNVMSVAHTMPGHLRSLTDLGNATMWTGILSSQLEGCIRRARVGDFVGAPQNLRERIADLVVGLDERIQKYKAGRLATLTEVAREAAQSAVSSAASASSAAGTTSEAVLSTHYDALASAELAQANLFRTFAICAIFTAALTTLAFVLGPELDWEWAVIGSTDYVHLLQRVLFVGAVLGLAGYFSRQAHQHRSTANWARALSVQLKTFNAFLAPLSNRDLSDELRRNFGARVFGDHPAMKGEPAVSPSSAAMDAAVGWAAKLAKPGGS